jgi:hypothetical protein
VAKILWYTKETTTMSGKRKKKIPPETLEKLLAQDENHQSLLRTYERAKIELVTGKRPPPHAAPQGST